MADVTAVEGEIAMAEVMNLLEAEPSRSPFTGSGTGGLTADIPSL